MPRVLPAIDELEKVAARSVEPFIPAMEQVVRAATRRLHGERGPRDFVGAAFEALRTIIADSMTFADLLGRRRIVLEARAAIEKEGPPAPLGFSADPLPAEDGLPEMFAATRQRIKFKSAIADLVNRTPELAVPIVRPFAPEGGARLEKRWEAVARMYRESPEVFAIAKSAEITLTKRVALTIKRALEGKLPDITADKLGGVASLEQAIRDTGDFTRAYAETVYRTNLTNAYSAGRFQQLKSPAIRRATPALEFMAIPDRDVRRGRSEDRGENHLAANGLIAPPEHHVWDSFRPPLGYQCRCTVRAVTRGELLRAGLLNDATGEVTPLFPPGFDSAAPHPEFVGRASVYSGDAAAIT